MKFVFSYSLYTFLGIYFTYLIYINNSIKKRFRITNIIRYHNVTSIFYAKKYPELFFFFNFLHISNSLRFWLNSLKKNPYTQQLLENNRTDPNFIAAPSWAKLLKEASFYCCYNEYGHKFSSKRRAYQAFQFNT